MSDVIVIGVAGGTGSGKTTLVKALVNRFGDNITVLSHDNYYKRHDELTYEERTKLNYDHPDAFDTDMMIEHLQQLREGHAIECPTYDYTIHNRAEETITIEPRKVIVVEGILIFASRVLCDQMDIKIFVDADADVRLCRRIRRDVKKRGRTIDSVIEQYLTTVKPMHEQFVEPSKKKVLPPPLKTATGPPSTSAALPAPCCKLAFFPPQVPAMRASSPTSSPARKFARRRFFPCFRACSAP